MRAMILAAGRGQRMGELTCATPKPLLKINDLSLIEYHLYALAKANFKEVVINICYLGNQIRDLVGDGAKYGLAIQYSFEATALDTGGGIMAAIELLAPNTNDSFLVISADIFTDFDFTQIFKSQALAHLYMVPNPSYHPQGDFCLKNGMLSLEQDKKLTYANIGVFSKHFFKNAPTGAFPLSLLLKQHIAKKQISAELFLGQWFNVGTPQDLIQAELSTELST